MYTTSQTAGRGRRGHTWVNAAGQALYYSCVVQQPLVQPGTLPLLSCLVTAKVLHGVYGIDCRIKWPNDLLLNGKKIVGILCEDVYKRQVQEPSLPVRLPRGHRHPRFHRKSGRGRL